MSELQQECQYCGKTFSGRMRQCPFCGAGKHIPKPEAEVACPRCQVSLERHGFRGNEIEMCPQCSGIWLGTSEFKYLTSERDVYRDDSIPQEFIRTPLPHKTGYTPCPACGHFMVRRNFSKISGVIIDICRDHGVWLDTGELEQIRSFVANGGLDASQDRQIEENREAIRSLDTRLSDVEFMQKLLHHWNFKRWMFFLRGETKNAC